MDRRQHRADHLGLARAIGPQEDHPVALFDPLLSGAEQLAPVGGVDLRLVQSDQRLGMCAGIGQLDRPGRGYLVRGTGGGFDLGRPLGQLLGFHHQKVGPRLDAGVLQLGGLTAQLVGLCQIIVKAALVGLVGLFQFGPGMGIGQGEKPRAVGAQKQGAVGGLIQKGAVVAGDDDAHIARQGGQPVLQDADARQVQVVGRLVQKVQVRLGDCGAGQKGGALPAAGEGGQGGTPKSLGDRQIIQNDIDPPGFLLRLFGRQRGEDGGAEGQRQDRLRHILQDEGRFQAAGAGNLA